MTFVCAPDAVLTCGMTALQWSQRRKELWQSVAITNQIWQDSGISFRLKHDNIRVLTSPEDQAHLAAVHKDTGDRVNCGIPSFCAQDADCREGFVCSNGGCNKSCDPNNVSAACGVGVSASCSPDQQGRNVCSCAFSELERHYADDPSLIEVIHIEGWAAPASSYADRRTVRMWIGEPTLCRNPSDPEDNTRRGCSYIGRILAHEIGHYFGLDHTFRDEEDSELNDWSQFSLDRLGSTPPDPNEFHLFVPADGLTDDADWTSVANNKNPNALRAGHALCSDGMLVSWNNIWTEQIVLAPAQNGNPAYTPTYGLYPSCYRRTGNTTTQIGWITDGWSVTPGLTLCDFGGTCEDGVDRQRPDWFNAMSYHQRGPAVVNGTRYAAFTGEQLDIVHAMLENDCDATTYAPTSASTWMNPEPWSKDQWRRRCGRRMHLLDVCQPHGGDTDHDGICDNHDRCPTTGPLGQATRYTGQMTAAYPEFSALDATGQSLHYILNDWDSDGLPNECDLCPRSNDDNLNDIDELFEDLDGDRVGDRCDIDRDGDGCANDHDKDPDNPLMLAYTRVCAQGSMEVWGDAGAHHDDDGLLSCDIADVDADGDGIPDLNDSSPLATGSFIYDAVCARDLVAGCFRFSCASWRLRIEEISNPAWFMEWTDIRSASAERLILAPQAGTGAEMARFFTESTSSRSNTLLLTIYDGSTEQGSWKIDPSEISGVFSGYGPYMVLNLPNKHYDTLQAGTAFSTSISVDADGDGVSDAVDNCLDEANSNQSDRDGDGYGDLCDADVDQDGLVTGDDYDTVYNCLDQSTVLSFQLVDTDPVETALRVSCDPADLSNDGFVDLFDLIVILKAHMGQPPGPSARITGGF